MPATRWQAGRLADEVTRLGARALPREDYFRELTQLVHRGIDCDALCWHTLDPATAMITSDSSDDLVESGVYTRESANEAGAGIIASEYLLDDVNTFAGLARKRVPVATLEGVTRGHPEQSTRYVEVLQATGIPFELRAAFTSRGRAWGAVHVARVDGREPFSGAEVKALAHIVPLVADGIRTSLRFDAARRETPGCGPGLIVLGPRDEVELITPQAREQLEELRSGVTRENDESPPAPVLAVARSVRADRVTRVVSVPGKGGWITLHASLPEGGSAGRVAIVLDRASGRDAAILRLETYGVTARERETAALIAQGFSNAEIAAALVVSPYTVQDHVKSLFEKVGVGSRRELVARIFLDDYLPSLMGGAPVAAGGEFATA